MSVLENAPRVNWQAECCQAIDALVVAHRRLVVEREMTSRALTICHAQQAQLTTKDETIARLRQELRHVRQSTPQRAA